MQRGGDISYEWPTGCDLWRSEKVQKFIEKYSLNAVSFHGCALGLVSAKDGRAYQKALDRGDIFAYDHREAEGSSVPR